MNGGMSYFHRSISRMAFPEHVVNGQRGKKKKKKEEGKRKRKKDEDAFIFSLCGISG